MYKNISKKQKTIWLLILIGLCAIEFPGAFLVGKTAYPFVGGIPFFYAYILFWWLYLCVVIFYAYRSNWGRNR